MANEITIDNARLVVANPTPELSEFIKERLSYVDKSKQYQLRKMGKSPWQRAQPAYAKLKSEVEGVLYQEADCGMSIGMSSGFLGLLRDNFSDLSIVGDERHETGKKIVIPWAVKPYALRDYQAEAVSLMLANPRGVINLATGLGKTLIATYFIQQYKRRALVVCPSESVAKQFYNDFIKCFGKQKVGFYGGGKKKISDITVGS